MKRRIFISYSHADKEWVTALADGLKYQGEYDTWSDRRLRGGVRWWTSICSEIKECNYFIYIGTKSSRQSLFCSAELKYAYELNKPILPIVLHLHPRPNSETPIEDIAQIQEQEIINESQIPTIASAKNQKFPLYIDDDLLFILIQMEKSFAEIQVQLECSDIYNINDLSLPNFPVPDNKYTALRLASQYYNRDDYDTAKLMFNHVIDLDTDMGKLREQALKFLKKIEESIEVKKHKEEVEETINSSTNNLEIARTILDSFVIEYFPDHHDKDNPIPEVVELKKLLNEKQMELIARKVSDTTKLDLGEDDDD